MAENQIVINKMIDRLGVEDISDLVFEDITGGDPIKFSKLYEFKQILGIGGFGYVIGVYDKELNEEIALKIMSKNCKKEELNTLRSEADLLKCFDHQNIIRFKYFKEYYNYLILAVEWCKGGSLCNWVQKRTLHLNKIIDKINNEESNRSKLRINFEENSSHDCTHLYCKQKSECELKAEYERYENECSEIIKGILQGIEYLHNSHELIHRDIKPANILLCTQNTNKEKLDFSSIKICDFGLAIFAGNGVYDLANKAGGTLLFQAPEQALCVSYSKPVDIWACGFIMYYLISHGHHPISENAFSMSIDELHEYKEKLKILKKEDIDYRPLETIYYSEKCKCLFEKLCEIKPNLRYQSSRALKHPWITKDENGVIPMNMYDEMQRNANLYDKLKLAQKTMLLFSILKDKYIYKHKASELNEYKCRIIKEEFLFFDPTPKSDKNKNRNIMPSFTKDTSTDIDCENDENSCKLNLVSKVKIGQHLDVPKNKRKMTYRPDFVIKNKFKNLRTSKTNNNLLQAGFSSNNSSRRKNTFNNSPLPNMRPKSSIRTSSLSQSIKKQEQSKSIKKCEPNLTIKTQVGSKKKLIFTSIEKANQIIKISEKETSSEESYNFEKFIQGKSQSTPLNLYQFNKFDRNVDIPIRKSNLDETISSESNEESLRNKISRVIQIQTDDKIKDNVYNKLANDEENKKMKFVQILNPIKYEFGKLQATKDDPFGFIKNEERLAISIQNSSSAPTNESSQNKYKKESHEFHTIKAKKTKEIEINKNLQSNRKMPYLQMNEMFIKINKNEPTSLARFANNNKAKYNSGKCMTRSNKSSYKSLVCKDIFDMNPTYSKNNKLNEGSTKRLYGTNKNP